MRKLNNNESEELGYRHAEPVIFFISLIILLARDYIMDCFMWAGKYRTSTELIERIFGETASMLGFLFALFAYIVNPLIFGLWFMLLLLYLDNLWESPKKV
jgi:hypothetical protein